MAAIPKTVRDAKLDQAIARLKAIHDRNRADLAGLPAKGSRTAPQNRAARDARDWMLVTRALLLVMGAAATTDIDDGAGVE